MSVLYVTFEIPEPRLALEVKIVSAYCNALIGFPCLCGAISSTTTALFLVSLHFRDLQPAIKMMDRDRVKLLRLFLVTPQLSQEQ